MLLEAVFLRGEKWRVLIFYHTIFAKGEYAICFILCISIRISERKQVHFWQKGVKRERLDLRRGEAGGFKDRKAL